MINIYYIYTFNTYIYIYTGKSAAEICSCETSTISPVDDYLLALRNYVEVRPCNNCGLKVSHANKCPTMKW